MRKAKVSPGVPEPVLKGSERSALFWLLYQHHDALWDKWNGRRVDWKLVSAWAEAQQAWDRNGRTPQPDTAQRTWHRVRALVAREKAERQAKQRPAHVRSPAINHVPVIAPPPQSRSQPPAPQETPQSDVERRMAEMKAMINRRSGRLA